MSEIANKIMETLEGIASDITNAKSTLTQNNVVLDSSTTKTLATEINKLPEAIKSSTVLDGFNKGKLSLRNGFIFSDSNATVMNSTNCVPVNASEYTIPRGVKFELKFPGWLANLESYAGEKITDTEEYTTTNIFKIFIDHEDPADALLYLYSSYIIDRLQLDSVVKSYVLKIVLNGEFFRPDENGYYNFNRFVFPCYDCEFYVRQADGSEVKITKFKCKEFFYSVNYMQRTISVVCDQLSVIMTDIYAISELNRQYSYMPNNFNSDRENRDDCHIINMPNVNIQYKTIKSHSSINSKNITKFRIMDYMVNASEDSKRLYISGTVQIRVNETPENIAKLNTDEHKANILDNVPVYNADGTKRFNQMTGTFGETDITVITTNIPYENKNKYNNSQGVGLYDNRILYGFSEYTKRIAKQNKNFMDNIRLGRGNNGATYLYYKNPTTGIIEHMKFNKDIIADIYEDFPLLDCLDGTIEPTDSEYNDTLIYIDKKIKFRFNENSYSDKTLCPLTGFSTYLRTYNGMALYCSDWGTATLVDGNYATMRSTNLLISPYDTEFYGGGDTRIERIYTNSAPLIYNANIKTIRVDSKYTPGTETLESNGILYPLMGIANTYPYLAATRSSAPTPATPMKYIIDKYTLLKVHPGKFFIDNIKGSIYAFDAKSRTVANFEKYIRILVPEDHFQLGTYAFNKYRLPIYNLNETKKYNYSNKTWEPVNATTPDVTYTRQMYGAEARADGLRYV